MTNQEIMDLLVSKKSEKTKKPVEKQPSKPTSRDVVLQEAKETGRPLSGKGRAGFYKGKKINREKFMYAINLIFQGEMGITRAYKYSGLSRPTFTKRANQLCTDGFIPGYLVEDGDQINFEIKPPSEYQLIGRELERLEKRKK